MMWLKCTNTLLIPTVLTIILFTSTLESKRYRAIMGPFRMVLRRWEYCPPEMQSKNPATWSMRVQRRRMKVDEEFTVSAEGMLPFEINNSVSFKASLASWSQMGGWKENAHLLNLKGACFYGALYPTIKAYLLKAAQSCLGESEWFCPMPAGIYRIENHTVIQPELPTKYFFYGRWKATGQFVLHNGEVGFCIIGYGDTVPK